MADFTTMACLGLGFLLLQGGDGQQPASSEVCNNAFIFHGAGFKPMAGDCTRFIQCDFGEGLVAKPNVINCPNTLFWNPRSLNCQLPENVVCVDDQCSSQPDGTYQLPNDTCAEFWQCIGDRTFQKTCCPAGQGYQAGQGCVANAACADPCPRPLIPINITGCGIIPHESDVRKFIKLSPDGRSFEMDCAPGTLFNAETCDCSLFDPDPVVPTQVCGPALLATFPQANTFRDQTRHDSDLTNFNVVADFDQTTPSGDSTSAFFNGDDAKLMSRRFNFAELDTSLMINVTFKDDTVDSGNDVALITNEACGIPPSIRLFLQQNAQRIVAFVATTAIEHRIEVAYARGDWNTAVMRYDGESLSLTANGNTASTDRTGNPAKVIPVQCSLQIGYSTELSRFKGNMDQFSVTLVFC